MNHLCIAAAHQHVGDRFTDSVAFGDRDQMRLTFGLGDADEIGLFQPLRLRDDRARDGNIVVVGELAHQLAWRVVDGSEPVREFRACLDLDLDDETAKHVVEQTDVIFVEGGCAVGKEIRDALDHQRPLFLRAILDDVFQLWNQRRRRGHTTNLTGRTRTRGCRWQVRSAW